MMLSYHFLPILVSIPLICASQKHLTSPIHGFSKRTLQAASNGPIKRENSLLLRHSFELLYLEGKANYSQFDRH